MIPFPAILLIAATLLPLAGFGLLLFLGKRLGTPLSGWVAITLSAGSFVCSIAAMIAWFQGGHYVEGDWGKGQLPIYLSMKWLPIGTSLSGNGVSQDHLGYLDLAIYIDTLTILLFVMVTLLALLVHGYSIAYMRREKRYPQFFTFLGLLSFSMLGLLIGGTLLQLFIFWELLAFSAYLLIGFWHERPAASSAAARAFVTARVADLGFLTGMGILIFNFGNLSLPDLWSYFPAAGWGQPVSLPGGVEIGGTLLTLMGIGFVIAAVGMSGLFPLHLWLSSETEAPTPASALIQAGTVAVAGVYLLARLYPLLTPSAKLFLAILAVTTLAMGALIALSQRDIERLLAFSTISQMGLMMLGLAIGSWAGGLFHLISHAFIKSMLILGVGSMIFASRREKDLEAMGGLARRLPITAASFAVGVLAMAQFPFFSGSYSAFQIIASAGAFAAAAVRSGRSEIYWALFVIPVAVTYLTAFYMTRCWMLAFAGRPRNPRIYERAREHATLWFPLVLLAVLSVFAGRLLNIEPLLESAARESEAIVRDVQSKDEFFRGRENVAAFARAWQEAGPDQPAAVISELQSRGAALGDRWLRWAFVAGIALAVAVYWKGIEIPRRLLRIAPLRWMHGWLESGMYFDELCSSVFVATAVGLSICCAWIDRVVVNGAVDAAAWTTRQMSRAAVMAERYLIDVPFDGLARFTSRLALAARNRRLR